MSEQDFVVVGGSHGIGQGIVNRLVARGANVTVFARNEPAEKHGSQCDFASFDVLSDEIAADQLPTKIAGLVYCPGTINLGPIRGLKPSTMLEDYQLNVVGAIKCLQAALPAMKAAEQSAMVMFSTVAVAQGLSMHASVAAAKGAIEGLTRALAAELAPKIRVNCVAPSLTDTPLAEKLLSTEQKRSALAGKHPLRRIGNVNDVAAAAEFLLTEESQWITGQVLGVDGGMSSIRT